MKFPKLDLVCGCDDLHPVFNCVKVTKESTFATEAHIIVWHKTSEIFKDDFIQSLPDQGILIPANAIKTLRKPSSVKITLSDDKSRVIIQQKDGSEITYPCKNDLSYPECESLFKEPEEKQSIIKIGINADLLNRLAQAMCGTFVSIRLYFYQENKAIIVKQTTGDYYSAKGLIMPVLIPDEL